MVFNTIGYLVEGQEIITPIDNVNPQIVRLTYRNSDGEWVEDFATMTSVDSDGVFHAVLNEGGRYRIRIIIGEKQPESNLGIVIAIFFILLLFSQRRH